MEKRAIVLHDALPDIQFEGKSQYHIVSIAREQGQVALSVGCLLSRVHTTGIPNTEMIYALPGGRLTEVIGGIKTACAPTKAVAAYAARDSRQFGHCLS